MTKLFIDTNIVIDLLAKRQPFLSDAAKLFSLSDKGSISLFTSALSITNAHYILSQRYKLPNSKALLQKLRVLLSIIDLTEKVVDLSLNDELFTDFEDAVQYYSAITNDMDIIITRNLKDFKNASTPVMTASAFLSSIKGS